MGWLLAGALAALSALPLGALAQEQSAGEERAMTMEAATGAQTENIPGGMLMVVAYGVVWALVFGYVGWLGMRQSKLAGDLARLSDDIARASSKAASKAEPEAAGPKAAATKKKPKKGASED
ncbi:MAG: CcmD family protein [Sandaracinaceae bacterium]|nr:CcmD family protein [Sandaracinaceae bacterium]